MKKKDFLVIQDLRGAASDLKEKELLNYLDGLEDLEKQRFQGVLLGALGRTNNFILRLGLRGYLEKVAT